MPNILIDWLVMTVAIILSAYLIPGVTVANLWVGLAVALALGILNAFIRPILLALALPVNILTLGLFTFVINALLILIVSAVIPGFKVSGFWAALLFSLVLSVILYIIGLIFVGV